MSIGTVGSNLEPQAMAMRERVRIRESQRLGFECGIHTPMNDRVPPPLSPGAIDKMARSLAKTESLGMGVHDPPLLQKARGDAVIIPKRKQKRVDNKQLNQQVVEGKFKYDKLKGMLRSPESRFPETVSPNGFHLITTTAPFGFFDGKHDSQAPPCSPLADSPDVSHSYIESATLHSSANIQLPGFEVFPPPQANWPRSTQTQGLPSTRSKAQRTSKSASFGVVDNAGNIENVSFSRSSTAKHKRYPGSPCRRPATSADLHTDDLASPLRILPPPSLPLSPAHTLTTSKSGRASAPLPHLNEASSSPAPTTTSSESDNHHHHSQNNRTTTATTDHNTLPPAPRASSPSKALRYSSSPSRQQQHEQQHLPASSTASRQTAIASHRAASPTRQTTTASHRAASPTRQTTTASHRAASPTRQTAIAPLRSSSPTRQTVTPLRALSPQQQRACTARSTPSSRLSTAPSSVTRMANALKHGGPIQASPTKRDQFGQDSSTGSFQNVSFDLSSLLAAPFPENPGSVRRNVALTQAIFGNVSRSSTASIDTRRCITPAELMDSLPSFDMDPETPPGSAERLEGVLEEEVEGEQEQPKDDTLNLTVLTEDEELALLETKFAEQEARRIAMLKAMHSLENPTVDSGWGRVLMFNHRPRYTTTKHDADLNAGLDAVEPMRLQHGRAHTEATRPGAQKGRSWYCDVNTDRHMARTHVERARLLGGAHGRAFH